LTLSSAPAGGTKQIRLSYNHPVKELVWCLAGSDATDSLWHFGKAVGLADPIALTSGPADGTAAAGALNLPISAATGAPVVSPLVATTVRQLPGPRRSEAAMTEFKLVLNGQDRFKAQNGKYFNQVQPFQHHSGCPYPGVYAYSFALKPEEHQPTGTCNFSRIDNAQVAITTACRGRRAQPPHVRDQLQRPPHPKRHGRPRFLQLSI
jgi:hypothetical protein